MKKITLCCAILFTGLTLQAQKNVNSTGGEASGSGGEVSYSVGQAVYTTNTGTSGSVVQGVQQPFEIFVVTGLEEAKGIILTVSAYPNPTTDYLQLKVESATLKDFSFQLFDLQGRLLQREKLSGTLTQIDMSSYMPSTYFVKVVQSNKEIKTFRIIKK